MKRVKFLKSVATTTASYGQGAVAWLTLFEAASFVKAGIAIEFPEEEQKIEGEIIVQEIKKPTKKRKK